MGAQTASLPVEASRFIGREREVGELTSLLAEQNLVTITGPGGSGKTRLALHVAGALGTNLNTCFVDLAPVADPDLVVGDIAASLGVFDRPGADLLELVSEFLDGHDWLVVLDNCEHVRAAAAGVASTLLDRCARMRVLATSQEALGLGVEIVYSLQPLAVPHGGTRLSVEDLMAFESVQLFFDRASAASPSLRQTERVVDAVAEICRSLDGLPLAIELAAARANLLGAEQIAERLSDRFRLLVDRSADAASRHATLRATLDWSYELLDGDERVLFDRISVFSGGFDLEAIERTCSGDGLDEDRILDLVAGLVDKSLVTVDDVAERSRYRLLETMRAYGRSKLDEDGRHAVSVRHLTYFVDIAERAEPEFMGPDRMRWMNLIESNIDNIRAALAFAAENDPGACARLSAALRRVWIDRGMVREGLDWLARASADDRLDEFVRARAIDALANLEWVAGDAESALKHHEEALITFARLDADGAACDAFSGMGNAAVHLGRFDQAEYAYQRSLELARKLGGGSHREGRALVNLGNATRGMGRIEDARRWYEESVRVSRSGGFQYGVGVAVHNLGEVALLSGEDAAPYFRESLRISVEIGAAGLGVVGVEGLATVFAHHEPARALRLFGAAQAWRDRLGMPLVDPTDAPIHERGLATARAGVSSAEAEALLAAGAAEDTDEIVRALLEDPTSSARAVGPGSGLFKREGDYWSIEYAGASVRLRDAKGLRYLAVLLGAPDREFHVNDLIGPGSAERAIGDAGEILDDQASGAYRKRLGELEEDLAEAESWQDDARASRIRSEIESIQRALAGAYGLGGRSRRAADPLERARKAVSNRIRDAVARISVEHAALGRHFSVAVRTGTFCSYRPEFPMRWSL